MNLRNSILALSLWALTSIGALAQTSPGLTTGQVPTAAQWNGYFSSKQDYLGATPLIPSNLSATTPIVATALGQNITISCPTCSTSSLASLTVGTTAITGGTTTRVLYDNAGVLGEYATIPSSLMSGSYTGITGLGTLTAGATGAGFTVALATSTITGQLPVPNGGTGAATFTANLPLIGNGSSAVAQGTRSGTTTSFATTTGALTSGDCVSIDANGNLIAAGGACTTGGGGGTVNSGTAGQVAYYSGTGTVVSGNPNLTIASGAVTVGLAGSVVGSVAFANATSGTIKVQPPTGALGSAVLTLPDATDTLTGKATTDTLTNKTINGASNTLTVLLASQVSDTLPVANGGTGQTTLTNHGVLVGAATSGITQLAVGISGTLLQGQSGADPVFTNIPTLGTNGGTGGQLTLNGATSGSAAVRVAAAAGTSTIFQLPASNGSSGQLLSTNGSGVTTWVSATGTGTVTSITQGTGLSFSATPCTTTCTISNGSGNRVLLNTLTASSSASLDDTTSFTSTYDQYMIVIDNLVPTNSNVFCELLVHTGGSFQATGYNATGFQTDGGGTANQGAITTYIPCSHNGLSGVATLGTDGYFTVNNVASSSGRKKFIGLFESVVVSNTPGFFTGGGYYNAAAAIDGFQIKMSAGNITGGRVRVYGIIN